jgi:hypothetical protein
MNDIIDRCLQNHWMHIEYAESGEDASKRHNSRFRMNVITYGIPLVPGNECCHSRIGSSIGSNIDFCCFDGQSFPSLSPIFVSMRLPLNRVRLNNSVLP